MNNSKVAVEKIKSLMREYGFLSEEKPELLSFSIDDDNNTILQVEKLEVGNKILKINEEFEQVSLENGSFKLKENFEISVENGEIVAVKEIFVEALLMDGTKVKVDGESLEIGAKVMVITEEGEIPAPDGVHELEDGTKIETEGGLIKSIESVSAPENPEEGDTAQNEEVELESDTAKNKEYEMEIYDMLQQIMKKMEEKMTDMKEKMEKMESDFNAFKKEPAAKPIKTGKTDFSSIEEKLNSEEAKIKAIMALKNK